jgi:hypothetical protein
MRLRAVLGAAIEGREKANASVEVAQNAAATARVRRSMIDVVERRVMSRGFVDSLGEWIGFSFMATLIALIKL